MAQTMDKEPEMTSQEIVDGINYINGVIWGFAASAKDATLASQVAARCQELLAKVSNRLTELEQELKEAKFNNTKPATEDRRFL